MRWGKAAFERDAPAIKPTVERLLGILEEQDRGAFITPELYTLRLTVRLDRQHQGVNSMVVTTR
jgi:hypothetical protein